MVTGCNEVERFGDFVKDYFGRSMGLEVRVERVEDWVGGEEMG